MSDLASGLCTIAAVRKHFKATKQALRDDPDPWIVWSAAQRCWRGRWYFEPQVWNRPLAVDQPENGEQSLQRAALGDWEREEQAARVWRRYDSQRWSHPKVGTACHLTAETIPGLVPTTK